MRFRSSVADTFMARRHGLILDVPSLFASDDGFSDGYDFFSPLEFRLIFSNLYIIQKQI